MQKTVILFIKSLLVCFSFLVANYNHGSMNSNNSNYYDSLYNVSSLYIKDNQIEQSMMILEEVVSKQRTYQKKDDILIMNARYDLGQIYLSRIFNYDKAVIQFEYIFNNIYSGYETEVSNLTMKSLSELKEKSLFMLGYIYHNHIGNFSVAQNYYSTFLSKFPDNDLSSSVEYELDLINKAIINFKTK